MFSLRWTMFGIPIRISFFFLLFEAGLAYFIARNDIGQLRDWRFIVAFVAVSFVTLLMMTMAHVLMGRRFGMPGEVHFYAMGATAVGEYPRLTGWQRFWVAAAGPITGIGLYFFAQQLRGWIIPQLAPWRINLATQILINFTITKFEQVSIFYTIWRSLPIQPLPGGDMVREILLWLSPRRGLAWSYFLSTGFALAGVGYFLHYWYFRNVPILALIWPIFAFGSLTLENFRHWIATLRESAKRRREMTGLPPQDEHPAVPAPPDDRNADPYANRL